MDDFLTIERPEKFQLLIEISEEKGLEDIPIPIKFAKELLQVLLTKNVKKTYP